MTDEMLKALIMVSAPIIVAYIGWTVTSIIKLRLEIAALKQHVSDNYPNNKDMDEVKTKLDEVVRTLYRMEGRSMAAHDSGN